MAILKCKMCGGSLNVTDENAVCECEFCGTQQTVPKSGNDENIAELFNRANDFRASFNFDKAERIYDQIIENDPDEAEAYWGLILCKFGIEYVKDPVTMNRVPTCHRSSYDPIVTDINYKNALKYANVVQKPIYEKEAKQIDEIQKGILTLARDEEPYDIFLCYKETDASGKRTPDSVIANDIYYQLTNMGYKVFYAAITLEDKLGSAYEPYIFAALNSAKIMLAIGTRPEYFKAVWVKNEWSRYLQIIKKDRKKLLVPCYRDMDAYELPDEFAHLQALDMAKIGFINDIERACEKVCGKKQASAPAPKQSETHSYSFANISNLLKRMFMFIEDGDYADAAEYANKILDEDVECGEAYLGKLLINLKLRGKDDLSRLTKSFENDPAYQKLIRFGSPALVKEIKEYNDRTDTNYKESIYNNALSYENKGCSNDEIESLEAAINEYLKIEDYKDCEARLKSCQEAILEIKYNIALKFENIATDNSLSRASSIYRELESYKDSEERAKYCDCQAIYLNATKELSRGNYRKAIELFEKIVDFKDSMYLIEDAKQKIDELETRDRRKNINAKIAEIQNDIKYHEQRISNWKIDEEYRKKNITYKIASVFLIILSILLFVVSFCGCTIVPDEDFIPLFTILCVISIIIFVVGVVLNSKYTAAQEAFNKVYDNLHGNYPHEKYFTSAISDYTKKIEQMNKEIERLRRQL